MYRIVSEYLFVKWISSLQVKLVYLKYWKYIKSSSTKKNGLYYFINHSDWWFSAIWTTLVIFVFIIPSLKDGKSKLWWPNHQPVFWPTYVTYQSCNQSNAWVSGRFCAWTSIANVGLWIASLSAALWVPGMIGWSSWSIRGDDVDIFWPWWDHIQYIINYHYSTYVWERERER